MERRSQRNECSRDHGESYAKVSKEKTSSGAYRQKRKLGAYSENLNSLIIPADSREAYFARRNTEIDDNLLKKKLAERMHL